MKIMLTKAALFAGACFARRRHRYLCPTVRKMLWFEHRPVRSAGVELEQRVRWGCEWEGKREHTESLFLCLWEVTLLDQIYKMFALSRFMSKWYPNKNHSWRNHLQLLQEDLWLSLWGNVLISPKQLQMTATSRLLLTLFPRLSLCFDLIPSPAVARHPTLQSWRPPKISEKAAFPYPSHAKIALIPVSSQIMNKRHIQGLKSYYQLSLFPVHYP